MFLLVKELVGVGRGVTREVFINMDFVLCVTPSKDGKYFEVEFTAGSSPMMTIEASMWKLEENLDALRVK